MRTIIIGDIHGCKRELEELLRVVDAGPRDRILCVGDLICKGPDSLGVLRWATRTPNVQCVLGNHEARFLECWRNGEVPERKPYDFETYRQLGDSYEELMELVSRWPLYREDPAFLLVHAGIDPRLTLQAQSPDVLLKVRKLEDTGHPWYDAYQGEKPVVFGHWVKKDPLVRPNAIGLDTGCVYGGKLTALVLPERRLVQVAARRAYRRKDSWAMIG